MTEKAECGNSLPQSRPYRTGEDDLPFGKLPPGLHILYEVKTLPDDTVPLRTGNRVFVLAAHPSWTALALDVVKTNLALVLTNPETSENALNEILLAVAEGLSRPMVTKP